MCADQRRLPTATETGWLPHLVSARPLGDARFARLARPSEREFQREQANTYGCLSIRWFIDGNEVRPVTA